MHFNLDNTIALTGFTPAAFDVKRKTSRLVTARFGLWQLGKPFTDWRKGPGIGHRVGSGGSANRALVDINDFIDMLNAGDAVMGAGMVACVMHPLCQRLIERFNHKT